MILCIMRMNGWILSFVLLVQNVLDVELKYHSMVDGNHVKYVERVFDVVRNVVRATRMDCFVTYAFIP